MPYPVLIHALTEKRKMFIKCTKIKKNHNCKKMEIMKHFRLSVLASNFDTQ